MLLSKKQERLILENDGLVRHFVHKLGYNLGCADYEDFLEEGRIGLIKAAKSFDESKGTKFATYASMCIQNELRMYHRKNKKHKELISLDEPVDENITIMDMIEDPKSDFLEVICEREKFAQVLYHILNYPQSLHKCCILYMLAGKKEHEIGDILKVSQSYVSRVLKRCKAKIRKAIEHNFSVKEEFCVNEISNTYSISFIPKDIKVFKKFFVEFMESLAIATEEIPTFKLICNKTQCLIQFNGTHKSFMLLAKLMQQMDDFEITVVPRNVSNFSSVHRNSSVRKNSVPKLEKVRAYILSLDCKTFNINEIREEFPGEESTVNNALQDLKRKGLIKSEGIGLYSIVENN